MKLHKINGNFKIQYLTFIALVSLMRCLPPIEEDVNNTNYSKSDPIFQLIKTYQDQRSSDSLRLFLANKKAAYRLLAAEAFGSYRDSSAVEPLANLLESEKNESVRQAIVFSLGQIGHVSAEKHLIKAFIAVDSAGPYLTTNSMILEALGKCGSDSTLQQLCRVTSYKNKQPILLEGQILSIYRFGLRNKFCSLSVPILVEVATNKEYSETSRLIAAHCLQRFKPLDVKSHYGAIKSACYEEKNSSIRMCLISALSRIGSKESLSDLEDLYTRILDNRIQCNLVKGLQNYPNGMASNLASKALQNPSLQISSLAAEYFTIDGTESTNKYLLELIQNGNLHWLAKSKIYEALIRTIPIYKPLQRDFLFVKLIQDIQQANNTYAKASYINALKTSPRYLTFILNIAHKDTSSIVQTTIAKTVSNMFGQASFTNTFKGKQNPIYNSTTEYLNKIVLKGNTGPLAIVAEWFRKEKGIINKYFKPDSCLRIAQNKLKLPRDIETYNELEHTISILKKIKFEPRKIEYNHPIQWNRLIQRPDTTRGEIITNKGKIEIELYPKLAPGSVDNFIDLAQQGFFKNKIIHRMVPNFVIQAGCPRGDGYGSLDYTIRTESNRIVNYQSEGMLGMASAGLDTECSQFFITFSPTPHLDGKYSIFGKMLKGMDVLSLIEPGDKVLEVNILE